VNETRQSDTQTDTDTQPETDSPVQASTDSADQSAENSVEETTLEGAEPSLVESDDAADQPHDQGSDQSDNAVDAGGNDDESVRPGRRERLEQEGDIAADYLEELLEISDLDGDLDMDVEGDRATVSIVGADLPQLVGDQGEVLEALQELTRLAVYRETGERSRLMLDVSGHRAERRTALEEQASRIVAQVKESGERATLEPMSPFERKVVHDVVAAAGLVSESEGAEPRRFVVVLPE
jgi:spoIIIJ-associated protein